MITRTHGMVVSRGGGALVVFFKIVNDLQFCIYFGKELKVLRPV